MMDEVVKGTRINKHKMSKRHFDQSDNMKLEYSVGFVGPAPYFSHISASEQQH